MCANVWVVGDRTVTAEHPVGAVLLAAASGRFPPVDGGVTRLPALAGGLEMVLAFTGHAYVATAAPPPVLSGLAPDGFGGAMNPRLLTALAGIEGTIGSHDVLLAASGSGGGVLPEVTAEFDDHPRVRLARSIRSDVEVYAAADGLITMGRGPGGRREIGVESHRPGGRGRSLVDAARSLVPPDVFVFAAVAPGNARALRVFLDSGFRPIAGEVIIRPGRRAW